MQRQEQELKQEHEKELITLEQEIEGWKSAFWLLNLQLELLTKANDKNENYKDFFYAAEKVLSKEDIDQLTRFIEMKKKYDLIKVPEIPEGAGGSE